MEIIAICIVVFIFIVLAATISFQLEVIIGQLKKINRYNHVRDPLTAK